MFSRLAGPGPLSAAPAIYRTAAAPGGVPRRGRKYAIDMDHYFVDAVLITMNSSSRRFRLPSAPGPLRGPGAEVSDDSGVPERRMCGRPIRTLIF
jgi:hypothetical protein